MRNVKMLLKGNTLVLIGNYWLGKPTNLDLFDGVKTLVLVLDVSNLPKWKLLRLDVLDGDFTDARMLDNQIVVFASRYIRWYRLLERKTFEDLDTSQFLPKAVDVALDPQNANLRLKGKKLPFRVDVQKADCKEVYYSLPDKKTLEKFNMDPAFSVIYKIPLDTDLDVATNVIFGSSKTQYVSYKNIYLLSSVWLGDDVKCSNARCFFLP